jgi:hypothetical protein
MGHDEDTNNFNVSGNSPVTPVTPNPRAQLGNNRLGMRPARNLSAKEELDRISADSNPNATASNGDIVLNAGAKPKKDKKIIVIIMLAIVTVIAIIASLFITKSGILGASGTKTVSKDEALSALQKFDSTYSDFVHFYSGHYGLEPTFGDGWLHILFPLPDTAITGTEERISATDEEFKQIEDIRTISDISAADQSTFNKIKTNVKNTISVARENVSLIRKFHTAFVKPVIDSVNSKKKISCVESSEISALLNDGNEQIKTAAKSYYEMYCEVSGMNYLSMDVNEFKLKTDDKARASAQLLKLSLKKIDDTSADDIKNLMENLEKDGQDEN